MVVIYAPSAGSWRQSASILMAGLGVDREVVDERSAEPLLGLVERGLDGRDRVACGLRRRDWAGEHELGGVVDDVPTAPRAAA
jgi:hypothetical protein